MNPPKPNLRSLFVAMGGVAVAGLVYLIAPPTERPARGADGEADLRGSSPTQEATRGKTPGSGTAGGTGAIAMDAQWREEMSRESVDPATMAVVASSSQAKEDVTIDLDPAARVPAALVQTHASIPLTARQERLKARITEEFVKSVKGAEKDPDAWNKARALADERFRILFGNAALQQQSVHSERVARGVE